MAFAWASLAPRVRLVAVEVFVVPTMALLGLMQVEDLLLQEGLEYVVAKIGR